VIDLFNQMIEIGDQVKNTLYKLGKKAASAPRRVLFTFIATIMILSGVAGAVGAGYSTEIRLGDADSQKASDLLVSQFAAASGDSATLVFHSAASGGLASSKAMSALSTTFDAIKAQPQVQTITPMQLSADQQTGFVNVQYSKLASELSAEHLARLKKAVGGLDKAGVESSMRGPVVDRWRDRVPPMGEFIGILAALLLVTLLFRSFFATLVTVGAAILGLILGNTVLAVISGFVDIPSVAPTIAIMLGLGAGIDYALFLVSRYRARLRAGDDTITAAASANSTTGASVVTAGAIVVVSILGLFVTGIDVIGRMGLAAAIVVSISALTAVTLVPALLKLVGRRVLPRAERKSETSQTLSNGDGKGARKIATFMSKKPWISTISATLALLVLAAPAMNLNLGQPDDSNRPAGDTMRVAYERLADGFGPGFNGPLMIAVDLKDESNRDAVLLDLGRALDKAEGVASVAPAQLNEAGDTAVLTVIPETAPQDKATSELVRELRDRTIPDSLTGTSTKAFVGGQTATYDDLASKVQGSLLLLVLVVVGLSLLLLTYFFRSVALPLASAFMNLLSIGAAYGVVTLAFQTEVGAQLLGVDQQPIVSFVPMLMFAILFGLSMDYNVFLISAVREAKERGESARKAVISGIGRTASLISTAGAIMALVFLGFMITDETEVKMIGLGLAVAVIVDVTLVRLVLAPGLLSLLGEKAWWIPKWLNKSLGKDVKLEH
jgi:putative drug exporter of the RND superfamily